jgi:hypothetical protein
MPFSYLSFACPWRDAGGTVAWKGGAWADITTNGRVPQYTGGQQTREGGVMEVLEQRRVTK